MITLNQHDLSNHVNDKDLQLKKKKGKNWKF